MYIFLTFVVVVCNDGVPPRLSNVLITGIPVNDTKEFKTWNFVEIFKLLRERKHFLASRLIHTSTSTDYFISLYQLGLSSPFLSVNSLFIRFYVSTGRF